MKPFWKGLIACILLSNIAKAKTVDTLYVLFYEIGKLWQCQLPGRG